MVVPLALLPRPELAPVVAPVPHKMAPSDSIADAMIRMQAGRCPGRWVDDATFQSLPPTQKLPVNHDDVLVLDGKRLVGIVTARDMVRLSAAGQDLWEVAIAQIMTSPVRTLPTSALVDVAVPLALFERYHLHHLPLVDEQEQVVGMVTAESLWAALPSNDLLRHLRVGDGMVESVVQAPPTATLAELAQIMAIQNVRFVVIREGISQPSQVSLVDGPLPMPLGLVTERDLVDLLAQGVNLATLEAQRVMSPLEVVIGAEASFWTLQQLMQPQQYLPVIVTDEGGGMVGWVSPEVLLDALRPMSLYRRMECSRQAGASTLEAQRVRSQMVTQIALHIRACLTLQDVLDAATAGVRSLLQCDRVLIHQFQPDWSGVFVAESVTEGWTAALGNRIEDTCFRSQATLYQEGRMIAIDDVRAAGYSACHLELLARYQVKANLVVPLLVEGSLWGLLIGHQCSAPRAWQADDLRWLHEIGVQVAIAIHQATIHQQFQAEVQVRQRLEAELEEQRALLRTVIDTSPNQIFVKDWEGHILLANQAVADYYSTTIENLIGHYDREFHRDPAMADQYVQENRAVIDTQQPLFIPEERSVSSKGDERWLQWQKHPITLPATNRPAVLGMGVDITSHKEVQTVLRQYERIVSATTDGIALLDRDYVYRLVNQVYLDWHEKHRDEIVGFSVADLLGESVFEELVKPRLDRCLAGTVEQYEAWFDYKGKGRRFIRVTYAPYFEAGHTIGVVVTTHDITAMKLAEEALQEREQFLHSIYDGVEQCIFTVDVTEDGDFRFFSFNPAAERLTGQTTGQLRGKPAGEQVSHRYAECVQAGEPITYEECLTFKNRSTWWLTTLHPLRDAESRIFRLVGTSTNITQRKQAEIQLDMQWRTLERIAKADPLLDIFDGLLRAMEAQLEGAICSIMLCDRNNTLHAIPAPHLPAAYLQAIDGVSIGEGIGSCGTAVFRQQPVIVTDIATDPLWRDFQDLAHTYGLRACWSIPFFASDGRVLGTFAVYHRTGRTPQPHELDQIAQAANMAGIALEREQATQALEDLNQALELRVAERTADLQTANRQLQHLGDRLSLAVKSASLGIWEWNLVDNLGILDDWIYEFYGIQADPTEDFYQIWSNSLHPDDRPLVEAAVQQALRGEKDYEAEFRVIRPDGSMRYLKSYGRVQWDDAGRPLRMIGVSFDITEQKQMEIALRESEERWQLALKGSNDGIWDWDLKSQRVFYSSRWKAMRGYADDEVSDRLEEWSSRIHPDDYDRVIAATEAHLRGETEFYAIEYRTRHKNGSYFWILDRGQAWRDASGEVVRMSGSHTDISDRKQAEMDLQASETRYRQIVETQTEFVMRSTSKTQITFVNAAICRALGRSSEAIIGMPWCEFVPAEHLPALHEKIAALRPENPTFEHTNADYRANGQLGWTQWVNLGVFDDQGTLIEIQSVGRDVTQLHLTEDALRQSEERFRGAFANTAVGMSLVSPEGRFLKLNAALCTFLGYSEAELVERSFQDISYPDDLAADLALSGQLLEGVIDYYHLEKRLITKQGSVVWGYLSVSLLRDSEGQPLYFVSQIQDINDRKRAEAELQYSRDLREAIFNESADALFLVDPDSLCNLDCNQRAAQLFEVDDRTDLLDMKGYTLQRHPFSQEELAAIAIDFERDGLWSRELEYVTRRGRIFWGNIAAKPITVAGRNITLVRVTDISDRKQTEIALQTSEIRFRRVFESSVVGMLFATFDGQILDANDRFLEIVGYSRADLEAGLLRWNTMTPPEYMAIDQALIQQLQQSGAVSPREKEYFRKDGSRVPVLLGAAILPGTTDQAICVVVDISDRKRLEQEQNRMVAILEASTDYIGMSDAVSGQVIWNNTAVKQLCGIESDASLAHRTPLDYHPPWAIQLLQEQAIPAAIAQGSWLGETALIDAQGQEIPVSQLLLAHKSPQGEVEFFSAIMRDMRVHKAYEQQLERTNAELLRATRLKDEFLANMSHELRTPLNAILGMSEGLQDGVLGDINDLQRKAIATIETSGQHLLELINDILDLSKVSAGKLELTPSDVSLSSLCESSLVFVKQQALQKQIQLNAWVPPELDRIIHVDERRMRQVLVNLLTNAVKFTPRQGRVALEVQLLQPQQLLEPGGCHLFTHETTLVAPCLDPEAMPPLPQGSIWLLTSVMDTGIGITPQDQARLFQPFVQVDSSLSRQYEGTGLGLALVKQIVELHGGFVSLTSALGQGSCFTVGLPCQGCLETQPMGFPAARAIASNMPDQGAAEAPGESIDCSQPLILLAEDNQDNIDTLSSYLEVYGYRLILARDGQEAVEQAQAHHPALILMDIQMPGMDGLEAIRVIRQRPSIAQIPIIAVTALAMVGDRERCLDAGADMYLTKPLRLKQLVLTMQELLERASGEGGAADGMGGCLEI